jgi:hypothetical protein
MKKAFLMLFANLPSLALITGGVYLATLNKQGWGWLIFLGACAAVGSEIFSSSKEDK